jgi:hypothetical protein
MPYFTIQNFSAGLDLRRNSLTAPAGTLRSLKNLHVTPGGEIEKRFAFTLIKTVDPATKGLVECNQMIYVFAPNGPGQVDPTGPFDVGEMKLATATIEKVVDYDLFDNKVFSIVYIDTAGTVGRYYDGIPVPDAQGLYCRTYKTKVHAVDQGVLYFSAVGVADDWTGTGSGFIDLSLEDSDMSNAQALEVYYDKLAIFSETACQLWVIDPDPLQTQYTQTLHQAGTIAPLSALQYGSGDVLYLAPDGIRSLRARNASLAAAVSDIGSPLDPIMQGLFRMNGKAWLHDVISVLQPVAGRFWIILPDRVYVLSAFEGAKITAWSEYDPGFNITAAATASQRLYLRDDANNIYVYGGDTVTVPSYDTSPVEVVFPFHSGDEQSSAIFKKFHGIDCACEGEWDVYASYDPSTEAEDYLGKFNGPTFLQGRFPMEGHGTHISLRMRSAVDGPLLLSNMIVHYDLAESG